MLGIFMTKSRLFMNPDNMTSRGRVVVGVLLFFIGCAVVLAATAPLAKTVQVTTSALFIGTVTSLGTFLLSFFFVHWDGIRLADVGAWPDRWSILRFVLGFGIGLFIVALHTSLMLLFGHVRWVRVPLVNFGGMAVILLGFLALSCRESLGFHGYPLRRLATFFGLWVALFIVAVVFAVEHVAGGYTWGQALAGAGVGSLLFGMTSITTRGLAVPIGLHAAWNCGDWMRGGKSSIGLWKEVIEDGFQERAQLVGMVSYVLLMLSATLAFWWWWHLTVRKQT